jgi:hypothetical protein
VRAGELPKDLVLLVEDPDRISRQPFDETYTNAYQPLLKAGIETHFLSFRGVLKTEAFFFRFDSNRHQTRFGTRGINQEIRALRKGLDKETSQRQLHLNRRHALERNPRFKCSNRCT